MVGIDYVPLSFKISPHFFYSVCFFLEYLFYAICFITK